MPQDRLLADSAARALDLRDVLLRTEEVVASVTRRCGAEVDRTARWPEETIRALQAAGLGGLVVPPQHGGLGHGLTGLAQVCERLARECPSSALCFGMHCVGSAVLAAKATPDQIERYVEPINRGEHLTTLALSEPGTGAHFYLPETTLERQGDAGFRVSGTKAFVTNGGHADSYVVSSVAADPEAPPGEFSCLVVPSSAGGIVWGESWDGLGMRGNDSRVMELRDVAVPLRDLLGRQGDELWYVFEVIAPYFLIAMAGTYVGVAAAALDEAVQHVSARKYAVSGASLARQPIVQHRVGELWSGVERTRRLVYSAAARVDGGDATALPAVLACKAEAGEAAVTVANEAMTLAGGAGYRDRSRLERCLRDARAAHVMAPTTDILRTWTGRAVLGQPMLSD